MGIAIRLVLYPMALGLIVLAWQHYHGDPEAGATPFKTRSGVTSQGQAIQVSTKGSLLTFFNTRVVERCSNGLSYTQRWSPNLNHFVQHGDDVRGRETGSGYADTGLPVTRDMRVSARMDAQPSGTIRTRVRLSLDHVRVSCDSGPVTFELHR